MTCRHRQPSRESALVFRCNSGIVRQEKCVLGPLGLDYVCGVKGMPARQVMDTHSICQTCPVANAATDYFTATAQLYRAKQSTSEYKSDPKPCRGCPDKGTALKAADVPGKRTEGEQDDAVLQFVWVYWHKGAAQDELRFSIRSIEENYGGKAKITVVGDRPAWYTGHRIAQPRQQNKATGFERGLRDVLSKMETISRHPDIDDEFVWMMDDVFMVQPTSREQLMQPRAGNPIKPGGGNRWRTIKANTARRLTRNGDTQHDYGTHLPHYVEKDKLLEMFKTWRPLEHVFLWEVAYSNIFKPDPIPHVPFLRRIGKVAKSTQYSAWAESANFFNVKQKGWCRQFRAWLTDRFPERSSQEEGDTHTVRIGIGTLEPIDEHFIVIQSAYTDAAVSASRLVITKATCIPSLSGQTVPPSIVVSLCPGDPHLQERREAFEEIGSNVRFVYREDSVGVDNLHASDPWGLPVGPRNLVGRLDDDDVLANDFCAISQKFAGKCLDGACIQWPNGYVWHKGTLHRMMIQSNQFIAIVSRDAQDPHQHDHRSYGESRGAITANKSRGWIWIRHEATISHQHTGKTMPRYLKQTSGDVNWARWTVDMDAIAAAAEIAQRTTRENENSNEQILGSFDGTTSPEYTDNVPADSRPIEVTT